MFAGFRAFFAPTVPPDVKAEWCHGGGSIPSALSIETGTDTMSHFFGCWIKGDDLVDRLLAIGKPVIDFKYIRHSLEVYTLLDPTPYYYSTLDRMRRQSVPSPEPKSTLTGSCLVSSPEAAQQQTLTSSVVPDPVPSTSRSRDYKPLQPSRLSQVTLPSYSSSSPNFSTSRSPSHSYHSATSSPRAALSESEDSNDDDSSDADSDSSEALEVLLCGNCAQRRDRSEIGGALDDLELGRDETGPDEEDDSGFFGTDFVRRASEGCDESEGEGRNEGAVAERHKRSRGETSSRELEDGGDADGRRTRMRMDEPTHALIKHEEQTNPDLELLHFWSPRPSATFPSGSSTAPLSASPASGPIPSITIHSLFAEIGKALPFLAGLDDTATRQAVWRGLATATKGVDKFEARKIPKELRGAVGA